MRGNRRVRKDGGRLADLKAWLSRLTARHGKAMLVAGLLAGASWGVVVGYRALRESRHFLLREVRVEGNQNVGSDEVLRACNLRLGEDHVLFLSEHEVEEQCAGDTRLRQVRVSIEMPDRVVVRVEEQDTALYAATPSGLWKVNRYGEAWGPADLQDMLAAPLLVGAEAVMADPTRSRSLLRDTLSLIRTVSVAKSPFEGHGLIVSWDEVLGFTVHDTTSGFRARFGHPPFGRKFARLIEALDEAARRGLEVEMALLDNEVAPEAVTLRLARTAVAEERRTRASGVATNVEEAGQ